MRRKIYLTQWWVLSESEKCEILDSVIDANPDITWFVGFQEMIKANIHLLDAYLRTAIQKKLRYGFKHIGSKRIIEHMRYDEGLRTIGVHEFKINNNYTADFARLSMLLFPAELGGFFKTRTRISRRVASA